MAELTAQERAGRRALREGTRPRIDVRYKRHTLGPDAYKPPRNTHPDAQIDDLTRQRTPREVIRDTVDSAKAAKAVHRAKRAGKAAKAADVVAAAGPVGTAVGASLQAKQAIVGARLPKTPAVTTSRGARRVITVGVVFVVATVLASQVSGRYFAWDLKSSPKTPAPPSYVPLYPGQQPIAGTDRPPVSAPPATASLQGAVA